MSPLDYTIDAAGIVSFARRKLDLDLDSVQAGVLAANPHYCILNCSRQWGKSTITAIKALHTAMFQPSSLTLVLSPSERQSAEFINKIQDLLLKLGQKPRGDGKNSLSILLPNKSRIVGLPAKESNIRGFSKVSLLLIDEASRVPDELYQCVRPMLAVSGGALWLIGTPFGRRGFFYREWSSNDSDWSRVSVTAYQCPRIKREFLDSERRTLGEFFFRQEYLCEFHDEGGQLISRDLIDRSISSAVEPLHFAPPPLPTVSVFEPPVLYIPSPDWPDLQVQHKLFVGVDFGKRHDFTAIAILEKSKWLIGPPDRVYYQRNVEIRYAIRHLERFPLGTTYLDIGARIGQLVRAIGDNPCAIVVDATGVGEAAAEIVRNQQLRQVVYPVTITSGDQPSVRDSRYFVPKRDLLMKLVLQFENGALTIASRLELASTLQDELASLGVKFSSAVNESFTPWRENQHDDLVFAVALANWRAEETKWSTSPGPTQGRLYW